MVYNHILAIRTSQSIGLSTTFIPHTETQVTYYNIICTDSHRITGYTDTLPGCSLSGKGQISILYIKPAIQKDSTCHIEHNRPGTFLQDGMPKAPLLHAILQCRDVVYFSTTPTGSISAEAFGTRESR